MARILGYRAKQSDKGVWIVARTMAGGGDSGHRTRPTTGNHLPAGLPLFHGFYGRCIPVLRQDRSIHHRWRLQREAGRPIYRVSFGTMDINALVISGSDPGAVPGDSTKNRSFGGYGVETGSTNV